MASVREIVFDRDVGKARLEKISGEVIKNLVSTGQDHGIMRKLESKREWGRGK